MNLSLWGKITLGDLVKHEHGRIMTEFNCDEKYTYKGKRSDRQHFSQSAS